MTVSGGFYISPGEPSHLKRAAFKCVRLFLYSRQKIIRFRFLAVSDGCLRQKSVPPPGTSLSSSEANQAEPHQHGRARFRDDGANEENIRLDLDLTRAGIRRGAESSDIHADDRELKRGSVEQQRSGSS